MVCVPVSDASINNNINFDLFLESSKRLAYIIPFILPANRIKTFAFSYSTDGFLKHSPPGRKWREKKEQVELPQLLSNDFFLFTLLLVLLFGASSIALLLIWLFASKMKMLLCRKFCCYTFPKIVDYLSRNRKGLKFNKPPLQQRQHKK